jgi:hypothetical protein
MPEFYLGETWYIEEKKNYVCMSMSMYNNEYTYINKYIYNEYIYVKSIYTYTHQWVYIYIYAYNYAYIYQYVISTYLGYVKESSSRRNPPSTS